VTLAFPHSWEAEILPKRPLIKPLRCYTYPREAEEVERGAMEVMVRPARKAVKFLATFALGFEHLAFRPVLEVGSLLKQNLLLFVGHQALLAWGARGEAWQTRRLSSEGLRITEVRGDELHGFGWDLITDREVPFMVDLRTGDTFQAGSGESMR
jgi:hypothetical protein